MSSTPVKDKTGGSNKRKTIRNVTGHQRGMLAWERDQNKGLYLTYMAFGGEGCYRMIEINMKNYTHPGPRL